MLHVDDGPGIWDVLIIVPTALISQDRSKDQVDQEDQEDQDHQNITNR